MTARERILAAIDGLGVDEREVLAIVAERLVMGRAQYGELQLATDRRDFRRECIEEVSDALVYAAVKLVERARPATLDAAVDEVAQGAGQEVTRQIGEKLQSTVTYDPPAAAQAVASLAAGAVTADDIRERGAEALVAEGRMCGLERDG